VIKLCTECDEPFDAPVRSQGRARAELCDECRPRVTSGAVQYAASYAEIGAALGISKGRAQQLGERALRKLAGRLTAWQWIG